ncbi:MAG: histidinol-phosphatase [Desulfatirhabdiaceae bacterium]
MSTPQNSQSPPQPPLVSVHGGHSADYCQHAQDFLEDMVKAYHHQKFSWVGITEHMPPVSDAFLYPDEKAAGLTAQAMQERFGRYVAHCRKLQTDYRGRLTIYVGMETEAYDGAVAYALHLKNRFDLDYVVGSVHHVADIPIDMTLAEYERAVSVSGGIENLYLAYFDLQQDMINTLKPSVVGHFDLIRIFDPDYSTRLKSPAIWQRIRRNLETIASLDLILDLNVRALFKGSREPYVSHPILELAREMSISVVPGDDSHSVDTVGRHVAEGIRCLESLGFSTAWPLPRIDSHHYYRENAVKNRHIPSSSVGASCL